MNGAPDPAFRGAPVVSDAPIFDGLTYIQAWRDHVGGGQPWDLEMPGCAARLMLVPEGHCRVPFRVLGPSGTWANPSNVVIPFNHSHLDGLFSCLRARKTEWDVLEFVVMLSDPGAADPIRQMLRRHGLRLIRSNDLRRPYIRIESSWETYYRQRSKNLRQDIARRLNKMKRAGGMRVERASGEEGLAALETFFALHQKRWKHRGISSVYTDESYRNFMRRFLGGCVSDTWWLYSLILGERVIATLVELASGRTLYYHQVAMDPDFSEFSPGKLIVYSILRDAFQKGFAEVDLGYGADEYSRYKANWATGERIMRRFRVAHHPVVAGWLRLAPHVKATATFLRARLTRRSGSLPTGTAT